MIDPASFILLARLGVHDFRPAAAAIYSNIGLLAVVGAMGYGVLLWNVAPRRKAAGESPSSMTSAIWRSPGALAGLAIMAGVFLGQILLSRGLRPNENFEYLIVLFLCLLGMWAVALVVWLLNPSPEGLEQTIGLNLTLIIPALLAVGFITWVR